MKAEAQALKGHLDVLLLATLEDGPRHGYAIKEALRGGSGGRFDLPPGTSTTPGQEFRYVWHCHVLEHEDNEMMRPYVVVG